MSENRKKAVVYVHGRGGHAEEAEHYKPLFPQYDVFGFDYEASTVMEARPEFDAYFKKLEQKYASIYVIASSLGGCFVLSSLQEHRIDATFLISAVVDMEQVILTMMKANGISEEELREKGVIPTGEDPLSWEYLLTMRSVSKQWNGPLFLLYSDHDGLTDQETMLKFAEEHHAPLTIMKGGEHWFHTEEQMRFLDGWIQRSLKELQVMQNFDIHTLRPQELEETMALEPQCFPPEEALCEEQMRERMEQALDYVLVAQEKRTGRIVASISGIAVDEEHFRDEFLDGSVRNDPQGRNLMILGLEVLPDCRGLGLASLLMHRYLTHCMALGQKRAVLTCRAEKVKMYQRMGFHEVGLSASSWGGLSWHEMECSLF